MKRILPFLVSGFVAITSATAAAQAPAPGPAGTAPQASRPTGGEPLPNDRTGFQVDRFFADPANATARLSNGGLLARATCVRNSRTAPAGPLAAFGSP